MKKVFTIVILALSFNAFTQIPTTGLIAYYPFTGNANDMSGNGYNGTLHGPVLTFDRFGNPNCAYSFDGINDYIEMNIYASNFNFQQPATISFWVKSNLDDGQAIYCLADGSFQNSNSAVILIGNNTTSTLTDEIIGIANKISVSDHYITGFTTPNRDALFNYKWHNIVVLFDNILTAIYLDNNLLSLTCNYGTNNGHYGNIANATNSILGNNGYGAFLNGFLDDFRIYNSVLTPTEITALYNETITDIETAQNNNIINIYPNPANNVVNINTGNYSNMANYSIKIENNIGQIVYQTNTNQQLFQINVNELGGSGIYFIKIINDTGNTVTIRKIVLQ